MEEILRNLGENKVTLDIAVNDYEQSLNYRKQTVISQYPELLNKKSTVIKQPALPTQTPTKQVIEKSLLQIVQLISDNSAVSQGLLDSIHFKKLTKIQQASLTKKIMTDDFSILQDYDLKCFGMYIKKHLYVIEDKTLTFYEDSVLDEAIVLHKHNNAFTMDEDIHKKPLIHSVEDAQEYLAKSHCLNEKYIDTLSAKNVQKIAELYGIDLYKIVEGKKKKRVKDDLKREIVRKI